ncbi:MAG: M48 family metalloprotease [Acidobacteriota bacterium]|nr:M48 family metalloprotease [Acidobacteriota bacterium]
MLVRFILLTCFSLTALGADRVLPPVRIQVNNPEGIRAPVNVRLLSRRLYRFDYKDLAETTVDINGQARFDGQRTRKIGWLGFAFDWEPAGFPERRMVYEIRVRKGPRVSGGRSVKPDQAKSNYYIGNTAGGDCNSLFAYEMRDGVMHVSFTLPGTYAPCEADKRAIGDVTKIGQRNINRGKHNFYGFPEDKRMGSEFFTQLKNSNENPPLKDARVNNYVRKLVDKIGKASDMPDLAFNVTVIDADVLNAFAVPGGYIWVYRGLIEQTETEAELVGVLAHEIAHVTSRHGTEGMTSAIKKVVGAQLVGELLASQTDDAATAEIIRGVVAGGTQFWVMGGTRKQEAEADRLGAQYAWRAGYDPAGIATLFQRWAEKKGPQTRIDQFFSEHPNDDVRVANTRRDIGYFLPPQKNLIVSSNEYKRIKRYLKTLPPPKVRGQAAGQALFSSFAQTNEALLSKEIGEYLTSGKEVDTAEEDDEQPRQ